MTGQLALVFDNVAGLEAHFASLEELMGDNSGRLANLTGDVSRLTGNIASLQAGIGGLTGKIADLQTATNGNSALLKNMTSQISSLANSIGTLSALVSSLILGGGLLPIQSPTPSSGILPLPSLLPPVTSILPIFPTPGQSTPTSTPSASAIPQTTVTPTPKPTNTGFPICLFNC